MNRQPTEQIREQDAYTEGMIDADQTAGADIMLLAIARAQAFRVARGRRLRPGTLARLGLDDFISVN